MSVKYCPFASWDQSVVNDPEISKQWCIDSCALWSNGGCGLLPSVSGDSEIERLRRVEKAYNAEWRSPGPTCTCDEAFSGRGLEDPDCMYHRSPLVWDALAALAEEASHE